MIRGRADIALRFGAASLIILGATLIAFVAGRYLVGQYRADVARRQWDERRAQALVAQARDRANVPTTSVGAIAAGAPVARLSIPRIRLDEIVIEGVGDDELNAGPGHLPGSALPGMRGNAVISAHRDRHFRHLDRLQLGDNLLKATAHAAGG